MVGEAAVTEDLVVVAVVVIADLTVVIADQVSHLMEAIMVLVLTTTMVIADQVVTTDQVSHPMGAIMVLVLTTTTTTNNQFQ